MARDGWHIVEEAGVLTVARRWPARFDVAVETVLPMVSRRRLAQQVRQDVWRALRRLKGFSPVVRVAPEAGMLAVTAGGQVDGPVARAQAEARIAGVLADAANRERWIRWAS
ncbi:MAG: hypothetical protein RID23_13415 [Roseovarius sp.]